MPDNKVKFYKNHKRHDGEKSKPYIPQYQVLGVEPHEYKSAVVSEGTVLAQPSPDNPRRAAARNVSVRQPYAAAAPSPVGRGRGPIPNVGNNVEHTWSGVDEEIIDDLPEQPVDPNQEMVDNNEFVSSAALGVSEEPPSTFGKLTQHPTRIRFTKQEIEQAFNKGAERASNQETGYIEDLFVLLHSLEDGTYLLLVDGVPLCSGPKEDVEEQARALFFGEHEICEGNPVPEENIVIVKRASIKVGLFLE